MDPPVSPTPDTAVLTTQQLEAVSQLSVIDSRGQPVRFSTIYEPQRTLVVLIRHFWCPYCRDYVSQLAKIPVEAFTQANLRLVVIGCGEPSMIKNYRETTGLQHDMYADPTRKLYDAIGARTSTEKATGPATYGHDAGILSSIRAIWKEPIMKPTIIGKQGKIDQLGADLILGPGQVCSYTRRMKNVQDHTPVSELMAVAGVTLPSSTL